MRITSLAALAAVLFLNGCEQKPQEPVVTVEEAWIRLPAVPGRPAAGYFTAEATSESESIVSVSTPNGRIELHESMTHGGMSSMRPMASVDFERVEPLVFEPGGKHLMLFDLDPALKSGDTVALAFRFSKAPPVTVEAEVRAAGEDHGGH